MNFSLAFIVLIYEVSFAFTAGNAPDLPQDGACHSITDHKIVQIIGLGETAGYDYDDENRFYPSQDCLDTERSIRTHLDFTPEKIKRELQSTDRTGSSKVGLGEMNSIVIKKSEKGIDWATSQNHRCLKFENKLRRIEQRLERHLRSKNYCKNARWQLVNAAKSINRSIKQLDASKKARNSLIQKLEEVRRNTNITQDQISHTIPSYEFSDE